MNRFARSLWLALGLGLASLAVSAADAQPAVSDEELNRQVEAALAADPVLSKQKIKVSTKKAEVSLTGVVKEQDMMVAAGHLVEKIPGVKYVLNEIDNEDYLREQAAKQVAGK
ncbi:BON domain-containing protein [Chitinimonas sp.]|uniref:BON domain-containing protein n=1 Tax=Chitinimonas sp. TaxID=1934313 RepID=UPI0035B47C37